MGKRLVAVEKFERESWGKGGKRRSETEAEDDDFNIHSGVVKNMVVGQGK